MRRTLLALVVTSSVALGSAPRAHACSCAEASFEELAAEASAIFEAQVVAIEPAEGGLRRVRLDVVQTWRAANAEHVEIVTQSLPAACGYPFEVGRSYLVLADRRGDELVVSLCGTRPMDDASEERLALGSGVIPVDVEEGEEEPASSGDEPSRPQTVRHRGGGCAGCAVATPAESAPILGMIALALAIVTRRRRIR